LISREGIKEDSLEVKRGLGHQAISIYTFLKLNKHVEQ